jgi:hypothetical protein
MAAVTVAVPDPPGPDPYPPQYGAWQDCSGVGPNPLAELAEAAAAGDQVRLETAATAAITGAGARVTYVCNVAGADTAPASISIPIAQVRAVRLKGQTTGLQATVAPTNAAGGSGSGSPANAWARGGNAFGTGTSYFGTTDGGDVLVGVAAGLANVWLTADGVNLTLTAPSGALTLTAPDGAIALRAGGLSVIAATSSGITVGNFGTSTTTLSGGTGGLTADTTGPLTLGATLAPSFQLGNLSIGLASSIEVGDAILSIVDNSGGQIHEGGAGAAFANIADSLQLRTVNNGPVVLAAAGSGSVEVAGPGGISLSPSVAAPNASAGVDMSGWTTLGLGLPQIPAATLLAIATPLAGLTAFDSTNSIVRVNVGSPGTPNYRKAAGGPLVRATNTSGQSIPATTSTTITGWTAVTNVGAAFVPATGIFTAPVLGDYFVSAGSQYVAGTTILNGAYRESALQNASVVETREVTAQVASISAVFSPSFSTKLPLSAGDTLAIQTYQGTAGALALSANAPNNSLAISLDS